MGKLTLIITSVLIISLVFTGFIYVLGDLQNSYKFTTTTNYSTVYDTFNSTNNNQIAQSQQNNFSGGIESAFVQGNQFFNFLDTAFKNVVLTVKVVGKTGEVANNMVTQTASVFGIPDFVVSTITIIIGLAILIFIIGVFLHMEW